MKLKNYFSTLLLLAGLGATAHAQERFTLDVPEITDGMTNIAVHYNPFGTGGNANDTFFQTGDHRLYAYIYCSDSVSGAAPTCCTYNNGTWTSIEIPVNQLTMVSASDWKFVIPDVRAFFGVPADHYLTLLHIIIHDTGTTAIGSGDGIRQAADGVLPVFEPAATPSGIVIETTPSPVLTSSTSFTVHYHPYNDSTNGSAGNTSLPFENYGDSLYVYSWAPVITPASSSSHEATPWGDVGTTPAMKATKVDSNDYTWTVTDPHTFYHLAAGEYLDTLGVIFRSSTGSPQTENFYIPVTFDPTGVFTITRNAQFGLQLMPNPATSEVTVIVSNDNNSSSTIRIMNVLGQVVMTQNSSAQNYSAKLSLNGLTSGIYYVELTSGDKKATERLIKQ